MEDWGIRLITIRADWEVCLVEIDKPKSEQGANQETDHKTKQTEPRE